MSKGKHSKALAMVCVGARSVIVPASCFVALAGSLRIRSHHHMTAKRSQTGRKECHKVSIV